MIASVCIVSKGNYWQERFNLECALRNSGEMDVDLLVYQIKGNDQRLIEFVDSMLEPDENGVAFSKQFTTLKRTSTHVEIGASETKAYNEMFKAAIGDFYCMLSPEVRVCKNWLHDFAYVIENVKKPGLVHIRHALSAPKYTPTSNKNDDLMFVIHPENDEFTGASAFDKTVYELFGGFDQKKDLEPNHYKSMFQDMIKNGFTNVGVPKQILLNTRKQ